MSRRTIWFGVKGGEVQDYPPKRPSWPDIDTSFDGSGNPSLGELFVQARNVNQLRAYCLSPDTDHDAVLVFVDDDKEGFPLAPGVLVRVPGGQRIAVKPITQLPSTRLMSSRFNEVSGGTPGVPFGQLWAIAQAEDSSWHLYNHGEDAVQIFDWSGSAWVAGAIVAPGGEGPEVTLEAADTSPDGRFSFADLIVADQILQVNGDPWLPGNDLFESAHALDSNGNPGDPGQAAQFISGFTVGIDSHWQGHCGIMVWEAGEEPPCDFRPRLLPERIILLPEIDVAAEAVAGTPDVPIFTVPAFNVETVQATIVTDATAAHALDIALGWPTARERINAPAKVVNYDTTGSDPAQAGAAGDGFATSMLPNGGDLVQLLVGGNGGASKIGAGSKLVLRRRFIG